MALYLSAKIAIAARGSAIRSNKATPKRAARVSVRAEASDDQLGPNADQGPGAPDTSNLTEGQKYTLTLPGISAPFNNPYFDPASFTRLGSPKDIKRWRESEITHGRVSMLAALGFVAGENVMDYRAFMNFDGMVSGPAIIHAQQIEERRPLFWETLVLCIGLAEAYRVSVGWANPVGRGFNQLYDDYEPGNLGFDPLGLLPKDPKERYDMQTRELNNGRLAMIAIAGFVAQELRNGEAIFEGLVGRADAVNAISPN